MKSNGTVLGTLRKEICPLCFEVSVSEHIHLPFYFLPWTDTAWCLCQIELPDPGLSASTTRDKLSSFLYKFSCLRYFVIVKGNRLRQVFNSPMITQDHLQIRRIVQCQHQPFWSMSWASSTTGHFVLCTSASKCCGFDPLSLLPAPSPLISLILWSPFVLTELFWAAIHFGHLYFKS